MNTQLSALERSTIYRNFANAFRFPGITSQGAQEHMEAFDPAVYKHASSLYESSYTTKGQELIYEELMRFYHFFELDRAEGAELPDHITVELEFMHFLTNLEYKASERGDDVNPIRRAQKDFVDHHIAGLVASVVEKYQGGAASVKELLLAISEFMAEETQQLSAPKVQLNKLFT